MINLDKLFSKNTIVSTSIGTLMLIAGGVWFVGVEVVHAMEQIKYNATEIRKLKVFDAENKLAGLRSEERLLMREREKNPDSTLVHKQLDDVQNDLHKWRLKRDCLINPDRKKCEVR